MKLLFSVLVVFLALNEVFAEEFGPNEDLDFWTSSYPLQDDWLQVNPFREILRRITRKPRPHQFIGLMGKRSSANTQVTRKSIFMEKTNCNRARLSFWHKINSFVGLMGKRSQDEPEWYEWSSRQNYEARR